MKTTSTIVGLLAAGLLLLLAGCDRGEQSSKTQEKTSSQVRYLTIKGSDTMVHLVSSWAEEFMKKEVDSDLSVTGGGSGTGIAALLNGTTDICAASRPISEKELKIAEQQKVEAVAFPVAMDGIAVVVNPENPVSQLSLEQLRKIFTGAVDNWKQVTGPEAPILVLSRESSSGTFLFFQEHVLDKEDYSQHARFLPGTSAIISSIATDKWAIGYVGLGYALEAAGKVKTIAVSAAEGKEAVTATVETVKDGSYAIARPLYLYTAGKPEGLTKSFIDYVLSPEGQKIVLQEGYISIN